MERRGQTSIALDLPYFIELQFPGLDPVSAILMDISAGGLQVALPPQFPDPVAVQGLVAQILHLPFCGSRPVSSSVAWVYQHQLGLQFAEPLEANPADLEAFSKSL